MDIIEPVDQQELLSHFVKDRKYVYQATISHPFGYRVALAADEFGRLLINSCPSFTPSPELPDYPTVREATAEIVAWPEFLEMEPRHCYRGLSGTTVREYLGQLRRGEPLGGACAIRDKDREMPGKGIFYVVDGMHRLVAYCLFTNPERAIVPIPVFLCSGRSL